MTGFSLHFNVTKFNQIDQFALLLRQDNNFGNKDHWFMTFRSGLYGFYARLHGVEVHYKTVHAWLPIRRSPTETEYHLSSILFNMDSAIECLTFTLNALGYVAAPGSFRDVSDASALKKISPKDILGDPLVNPSRSPLDGYATIFPNVMSLWQSKSALLNRIIEQHDASKHRQAIYVGGMMRLDPPLGFYESLGISDDSLSYSEFQPMAEIILPNDSKLPWVERKPKPIEGLLKTVSAEFVDFIQDTGDAAFNDAKAKILIPPVP